MHNYFNGQGKIQVFPPNVLVRKISKTNWKIYRNWLEISSYGISSQKQIQLFTNDAWNLKKFTNNNYNINTNNNKDKAFGALLTNLSKAFVYRSDDLLIANFHANDLDLLSRT